MNKCFYVLLAIVAFAFLIMCKDKNQDSAITRSSPVTEPLAVNVYTLPLDSSKLSKPPNSVSKERFEKLIRSRNRTLISTEDWLKFPAEINNNFYIANLDKFGRFDLIAKAPNLLGVTVFPDDFFGFMDLNEARRSIKNDFTVFLEIIKSGRVKALDLREVYIPPEFYPDFVKSLNVDALEVGKSTFRYGKNGIHFSQGFSEIMAENVMFDQYFFEAIKRNPGLKKILILNGNFHGAINSPILKSRPTLDWLDELLQASSTDFENLSEVVLKDSDPRILTTITWLYLPSLKNINIIHENIYYHGGAIEDNFIQAVTCAIRSNSAWPNIRQISFSHRHDNMKHFKMRAEINHGIDQYLRKSIDQYRKNCKLDFVRQFEVSINSR
jgi:hypothetical protein